MNLQVEPEELVAQGGALQGIAGQIAETVAALSGDVSGLGGVWTGEDYDAAKAEYSKYQPDLQQISTILNDFGGALISAGQDYRARIDQNAGRFNA